MCRASSAVHHFSTMSLLTEHVESLRKRVNGEVATPDDERWDAARQAWNLTSDQQPELVVLPASVEDVIATVEVACAHDLCVATQGNGHKTAQTNSLAGSILLNTSHLRGV